MSPSQVRHYVRLGLRDIHGVAELRGPVRASAPWINASERAVFLHTLAERLERRVVERGAENPRNGRFRVIFHTSDKLKSDIGWVSPRLKSAKRV